MSENLSTPTPVPATTPAVAAPETRRPTGPSLRQLIIVVGILAATVIITALTSDVNQALEPGIAMVNGRPFLPEKLGNWQGGELQGLTPEEQKLLPADTEGGRRVYRLNGLEIACSIVLAGRDVTSIHRPEVCLPGQGWDIENSRTAVIQSPAAPDGTLKVMRLDTKRLLPSPNKRAPLLRSIFVYWFIGKDTTTPHHWQRILWTARDRVFHNRNHRWAYVLIHVPVGVETDQPLNPEASRVAMEAVSKFVEELYPTLKAP
jgi:EpsI family protein